MTNLRWSYIPPVTKVVDPGKHLFELTEEEVLALHGLLSQGISTGTRRRLKLTKLLTSLVYATSAQTKKLDAPVKFTRTAYIYGHPFGEDNPFDLEQEYAE